MLAAILPLLIFGALVVAAATAQFEGALVLAILLGFWCASRLRDERTIRNLLKRRIAGQHCSHQQIINQALLLSGLKPERDALLSYAIAQSIEASQTPDSEKFQALPQPNANAPTAKFYERVLENLQLATAADLTLVAIRQSGGLPPAILASGSIEPRLVALSARILEPLLNGSALCPSEPSSINSPLSPFSAFASFGFKLALARPFKEAFSAPPGIFLLLYRDLGRFGHHLVNELDNVTTRLETELSPLRAIYELSSQVQLAESQNRLKSDALASISHDMRSPLNNIRSIMHLLSTEPLSTEAAELLDVARSNCDSASEILETVLDFISHQAGRLSANRNNFNIAALLRDVVNAYRVSARLKGLELAFLSPHDNISVLADHRQVRRVIANVISNGIKYTERGRIEVELSAAVGLIVVVKIRDNGIGMSSEQVSQLFKPFTRFNPKSTEGVGLGLALSKALLELNGASISISSELNCGTEVTLTFATNAASSVAVFAPFSAAAITTLNTKRALNVLLVDDDPDATATLSRALRVRAIDCTCATTTRDALNLLTYEHFDAIVSDASMPDGGAARLLESLAAKNNSTPIIILTGSSREGDLVRLRLLGAAEILQKPATIDEIVASLEHICEQQTATQHHPSPKVA